jgi:4-hydroxy-3-methylbut-2-enyl diphosphate reductase IspH
MSKRVLLAAPRSFCAGVDRAIAARAEEQKRGNFTVSPFAPSLTRASAVVA